MSKQTGRFDIEETFRKHVEKRIEEVTKKLPILKNDLELTAATRLLEKRREVNEAELSLSQHKEEYSAKSDTMAQRRGDLVKKESQLKEALMKFDKFLKENDAKRSRAHKKLMEERKIKEQKEKEIIELHDELKSMSQKKEYQIKQIDDLMKYHQFLESTLELLPDYGDIRDIISRYETLKQTNLELMDRASHTQNESEKQRDIYKSIIQNKQTLVLNYNNSLAKYQAELEELQGKRIKAQSNWEGIMNQNQEKSLLISQVKMAVANIFGVVQSHLNHRITPHTEPVDQLDEIQRFYVDIDSIVKELLKDLK